MVPDRQTNTLYLADCLPGKFPEFFGQLKDLLARCNIPFHLLPDTKDIWAVDYMPVQIAANKFIQFDYNPDYLQNDTDRKSISDVNSICARLNVERSFADIILDGGNVVCDTDKVIMTGKVFRENPKYTRHQLEASLRDKFEIDHLHFVPTQPYDFTGHADGMLRFLDNTSLLVNDYSQESHSFQKAFRRALTKTGLNIIEVPYNPYLNKHNSQANGTYINYLRMKGIVIIPIFEISEDEKAVTLFEEIFKGERVVAINSNSIADHGGVLNCISWNILSDAGSIGGKLA